MTWVIKGVAEGPPPATPMEGLLGDVLIDCLECQRSADWHVRYCSGVSGVDEWIITCMECGYTMSCAISRRVGENGAWEGTEEGYENG